MLSNNGLCLRTAVHYVSLFLCSNSSVILTGFKFTELHTLTLTACSYVLLISYIKQASPSAPIIVQ